MVLISTNYRTSTTVDWRLRCSTSEVLCFQDWFSATQQWKPILVSPSVCSVLLRLASLIFSKWPIQVFTSYDDSSTLRRKISPSEFFFISEKLSEALKWIPLMCHWTILVKFLCPEALSRKWDGHDWLRWTSKRVYPLGLEGPQPPPEYPINTLYLNKTSVWAGDVAQMVLA